MSMPFNVLLFFASAASAAGDGFAANKRNRAAAVWLASEEAGFAVATIPTRRGRNGKSHSLTFRGDARTIFPPILYPPLLSSCLPNPLSLSLPLYVCASSPFCLCLSLVPALLAMCPFFRFVGFGLCFAFPLFLRPVVLSAAKNKPRPSLNPRPCSPVNNPQLQNRDVRWRLEDFFSGPPPPSATFPYLPLLRPRKSFLNRTRTFFLLR